MPILDTTTTDQQVLVIRPVKVSRMRWFILIVLSLANLSSGINWICFSPIANITAQFYSVGFEAVNLLSSTYMLLAILFGFFSCILIDHFGIKASIVLGSWLNFAGSALRVLSSLNGSVFFGYHALLAGQVLCALGQPFTIFVSTKLATCWFAENERALANTISLTANLIGVLVGTVMSPIQVTSISITPTGLNQMSVMLMTCATFAFMPASLSCFIRRSMPKYAPSESSRLKSASNSASHTLTRRDALQHLQSTVSLFKNTQFILLSAGFAIGTGVFCAITTLVEQIFCVRGYSNSDVSYFIGLFMLVGIFGSFIAGWLMDKTKRYEMLTKLCMGALALVLVSFTLAQLANDDKGYRYDWLLVSFSLLGLFAVPLMPICFETCVECTYPISESTSTGLLFIWSQIAGALMIEVYPRLANIVSPNDMIQVCDPNHRQIVLDYAKPLYFQLILMMIVSLLFTWYFKCPNLRLEAEKQQDSNSQEDSNRVD